MGKIPQYQREKFVSSYVGSPQMDTSGMQIADSASKMVAGVSEIQAKKLKERADMIVDQQANRALVDYGLSYQKQIRTLEKEYADNPEQFPTAVSDMGMKLQAEYADKIPDERVRARFGNAANTVVRQSQNAALGWAEQKQEDNAFAAWRDTIDISAMVAGQDVSVEGFKQSLGAIATTAFGNSLISSSKQVEGFDLGVKKAYNEHLRNRAIDDSVNFINDINAGAYDSVTFEDANGKSYTKILNREEKEKYKDLADNAIAEQRVRKATERLYASDGESKALLNGFLSGRSGLGDVVAYQERVKSDPEISEEEKANADALAEFALKINRKEGTPNPFTYTDLAGDYKFLQDQIKRKKNKPEKVLTELMKVNTKVINAMTNGEITVTEGRGLLNGLSGNIAKGLEGERKSFFSSDPYGNAYMYIDAQAKSLTSATSRQKNLIQGRAFSGFIEKLLAAEEQAPGVTIDKDTYMKMAKDAYKEAEQVIYPNTAAVDTSVNATASKTSGVTAVSSVPPDQKAAKTLSATKPQPGSERIVNGQKQKRNAENTGWVVVGNV